MFTETLDPQGKPGALHDGARGGGREEVVQGGVGLGTFWAGEDDLITGEKRHNWWQHGSWCRRGWGERRAAASQLRAGRTVSQHKQQRLLALLQWGGTERGSPGTSPTTTLTSLSTSEVHV